MLGLPVLKYQLSKFVPNLSKSTAPLEGQQHILYSQLISTKCQLRHHQSNKLLTTADISTVQYMN
jgi:hypothetical protein